MMLNDNLGMSKVYSDVAVAPQPIYRCRMRDCNNIVEDKDVILCDHCGEEDNTRLSSVAKSSPDVSRSLKTCLFGVCRKKSAGGTPFCTHHHPDNRRRIYQSPKKLAYFRSSRKTINPASRSPFSLTKDRKNKIKRQVYGSDTELEKMPTPTAPPLSAIKTPHRHANLYPPIPEIESRLIYLPKAPIQPRSQVCSEPKCRNLVTMREIAGEKVISVKCEEHLYLDIDLIINANKKLVPE